MNKSIIILFLVSTIFLVGCMSQAESVLKGSYQSERQENGYVVQMSFQDDDHSFVQYIDNRQVDKGTYEKLASNNYKIKSDNQDYEIKLDGKGDYEIIIGKVNKGKPFKMNFIDDVPVFFPTEFGDEEEYKSLLSGD